MNGQVIVRNSAKCKKCGDEIESTHVHHWVTCSCQSIFVDGGKEYLRRGGSLEDMEDTSEYGEFTWTTYDDKKIPLSEIKDDHLNNIIYHLRRKEMHVFPQLLEEAEKRNLVNPGASQIPWLNDAGELVAWNYATNKVEKSVSA